MLSNLPSADRQKGKERAITISFLPVALNCPGTEMVTAQPASSYPDAML